MVADTQRPEGLRGIHEPQVSRACAWVGWRQGDGGWPEKWAERRSTTGSKVPRGAQGKTPGCKDTQLFPDILGLL